MELFNKKFVHVMWDDELEGKECFLADYIDELESAVERDDKGLLDSVVHSEDKSAPFKSANGDSFTWRFAYYDPHYSIKKAFDEGKEIQVLFGEVWEDIDNEEQFERCLEIKYSFRVKPNEERKYIAYLSRQSPTNCYLTSCSENKWEKVQKIFGAKTKLFVGTDREVEKWYESRQKFAQVIKAWEDGIQIQCRRPSSHLGWIDTSNPNWDINLEYRIKPECPCADGIDSKACVGCEHSEDGKPHIFENYHCYGCDKSSKKYHPYINSTEMIANFIARFKVKCPSYAEPLIWIKGKHTDNRYLVGNFREKSVYIGVATLSFDSLLNSYTYLDGSPVGMEVKE